MRDYSHIPFTQVDSKIKKGEMSFCRCCHEFSAIYNVRYEVCRPCWRKYQWYGYQCDVPACSKTADGTQAFHRTRNKVLCDGCSQSWHHGKYPWEQFVEQRQAWLSKPKTFQNTTLQEVKQPVAYGEIAKCQKCKKDKEINKPKYQLCLLCMSHEQYRGESCWCCGKMGDGTYHMAFDLKDGIFVCKACVGKKSKYKLANYSILKHQIMSRMACDICKQEVTHDYTYVSMAAHIDHDHDTNLVRGVLCRGCNNSEGVLKKWAKVLDTDLIGVIHILESYLENPPLDIHGIH